MDKSQSARAVTHDLGFETGDINTGWEWGRAVTTNPPLDRNPLTVEHPYPVQPPGRQSLMARPNGTSSPSAYVVDTDTNRLAQENTEVKYNWYTYWTNEYNFDDRY